MNSKNKVREKPARSEFDGLNGYNLRVDVAMALVKICVVKAATGHAHSGSVQLVPPVAKRVAKWVVEPSGDKISVDGVNGYTLRLEVTGDTLKAVTLQTKTGHMTGIAKLSDDATAGLRSLSAGCVRGAVL